MFSFQAFSFSIYHLWPFYVGLPCSFFAVFIWFYMSPLQFWLSALLLSHLNFNSCFFLALSTVLFLPRVFLVWNACFILPFLHLRSFLCSIRCLAAQSTMSHFESFGLPAPACYLLLCPFVCCIMSWLGCSFVVGLFASLYCLRCWASFCAF